MGNGDDKHLAEVERVLLTIAAAKQRTAEARETLAAGGAGERFTAPLALAEQALDEERRRLMQATYYSVPSDEDEQETLAV